MAFFREPLPRLMGALDELLAGADLAWVSQRPLGGGGDDVRFQIVLRPDHRVVQPPLLESWELAAEPFHFLLELKRKQPPDAGPVRLARRLGGIEQPQRNRLARVHQRGEAGERRAISPELNLIRQRLEIPRDQSFAVPFPRRKLRAKRLSRA